MIRTGGIFQIVIAIPTALIMAEWIIEQFFTPYLGIYGFMYLCLTYLPIPIPLPPTSIKPLPIPLSQPAYVALHATYWIAALLPKEFHWEFS
jgi:hypothetical protein